MLQSARCRHSIILNTMITMNIMDIMNIMIIDDENDKENNE